MDKFLNPIPIKTSRWYWGDMIGIATDSDWLVCGVCEFVWCTYSEDHMNDLVPINNIYSNDKTN